MDVTVLQSDLEPELQMARGLAPRKHFVPVLAYLRLTADRDRLHIDATDADHWLRTSCPAAVADPGRHLAPADLLWRITKATPVSAMRFHAEASRLRLTADAYAADLNVLDVADFLVAPAPDASPIATVPALQLRHLFERTAFAIDTAREETANAVLALTETASRVVSSNGHLLVDASAAPWALPPRRWLFARRAVDAILALLPEEDICVDVQFTDTHVFLTSGARTLILRPGYGKPLPFERILSATSDALATVDRKQIIAAVERLLATAINPKDAVAIAFDTDLLTLSRGAPLAAKPAHGLLGAEAEETIPIPYNDGPYTGRVNGTYLLDVLTHAPGDTVTLGHVGTDRVTIAADAYTAVIMQMSK